MSPIRAPTSSRLPKASAYAVTTHCRSPLENSSACWAEGSSPQTARGYRNVTAVARRAARCQCRQACCGSRDHQQLPSAAVRDFSLSCEVVIDALLCSLAPPCPRLLGRRRRIGRAARDAVAVGPPHHGELPRHYVASRNAGLPASGNGQHGPAACSMTRALAAAVIGACSLGCARVVRCQRASRKVTTARARRWSSPAVSLHVAARDGSVDPWRAAFGAFLCAVPGSLRRQLNAASCACAARQVCGRGHAGFRRGRRVRAHRRE